MVIPPFCFSIIHGNTFINTFGRYRIFSVEIAASAKKRHHSSFLLRCFAPMPPAPASYYSAKTLWRV
jgi:hypothetical protein